MSQPGGGGRGAAAGSASSTSACGSASSTPFHHQPRDCETNVLYFHKSHQGGILVCEVRSFSSLGFVCFARLFFFLFVNFSNKCVSP